MSMKPTGLKPDKALALAKLVTEGIVTGKVLDDMVSVMRHIAGASSSSTSATIAAEEDKDPEEVDKADTANRPCKHIYQKGHKKKGITKGDQCGVVGCKRHRVSSPPVVSTPVASTHETTSAEATRQECNEEDKKAGREESEKEALVDEEPKDAQPDHQEKEKEQQGGQ